MAKKYYAVQQGRKPGIYETWAACEAQVKGFSGAVYKSFPTLSEAEAFMGHTSGGRSASTKKETAGSLADYFAGTLNTAVQPESQTNTKTQTGIKTKISTKTQIQTNSKSNNQTHIEGLVAYIDGSYDKHDGKVGSGGIIFYDNQSWEFSFGTADPFYTNYWNVSGELLGAMHVMKEAKRMGAKDVHLYYDYMGIEMWATGRWKTNNPLTQYYAAFCKEYRPYMKIHYHKVAAHTGVTYNERADQLAKAGTKK